MSTYDQPGSAVIAVFAARMLLEEAARLLWRFSESDPTSRPALSSTSTSSGPAGGRPATHSRRRGPEGRRAADLSILPGNVRVVTPLDEIAKGREPLPTISSLLHDMGAAPRSQAGWTSPTRCSARSLTARRSAISTVPASARAPGAVRTMTPEMLALALDVACLRSATSSAPRRSS